MFETDGASLMIYTQVEETDRLVKSSGYVLGPPRKEGSQGLGAAVSSISAGQQVLPVPRIARSC